MPFAAWLGEYQRQALVALVAVAILVPVELILARALVTMKSRLRGLAFMLISLAAPVCRNRTPPSSVR